MLVGIIFAFTAIAVVNTLMMIALERSRELALLRLVGARADRPGRCPTRHPASSRLLGSQLPTRLALRTKPVEAAGIWE